MTQTPLFGRILNAGHICSIIRRSTTATSTVRPTSRIERPGPMPPSEMHAWQVKSFGDIDKLEWSVIKKPVIRRPKEVIVKVKAASVNPIDVAMVGGYGNVMLNTLRSIDKLGDTLEENPLILGRDFSGEVVTRGNNVRSDIHVGDTVYGVVPPHQQGCHAEFVTADATLVCRIPDHLDVKEAAGLMYTGMTAWSALQVTGDLYCTSAAGRRVLVLGGSGGVGVMAIQFLKAWQAEVVTTCQKDAIPILEKLNPDLIIDYTSPNACEEIKHAGKYDVILDASGTADPSNYIELLKEWRNAKFITLKSPLLKNTDDHGMMVGMLRNVTDLIATNLSSGAAGRGSMVRWGFFMPLPAAAREISELVNCKKLVPVTGKVFSFNEMPEAYKMMKNGHARGKIIVSRDGS